jgi:hypothetical protein
LIRPSPSEAPLHLDVVFAVKGLSCGYHDYNQSGNLIYSPEVQWPANNGIAKFSRDRLIITYDQASWSSLRVEIPYRIIHSILTSGSDYSLTMTLCEPPRFFEECRLHSLIESFQTLEVLQNSSDAAPEPPKPTRNRLGALPNGTSAHNEIVGQAFVYQIVSCPEDFRNKVKKLRDSDILSILSYNLPRNDTTTPSLADGLKEFRKAIQKYLPSVKFEILFQVQGLVQNGYLLPWTGQELLMRLHKMSKGISNANDTNQVSFSLSR